MKKLLMTPGPVELPDYVKKVMAEPMVHHRTEAFEECLAYCLKEIKGIFKTKGSVFFQTATGSGGMESAMVNTLSPGDTVIIVNSGKFGERWVEMGNRFQLNVVEHKVNWGDALDPSQVEDLLNKNQNTRAVFTQACETSTGVLHPVKELGKILKNSSALLIVDAITALGTTDLNMDEWGLDVVVGGSQKAFMLPTGLTMTGYSAKAWDAVERARTPSYYWDVKLEKKANQKNQTMFSSAVTHIRALKEVLKHVNTAGIESFIKKHEILAHVTRETSKQMGLEIFPQIPSPSLTALKIPNGFDAEKIQEQMENEHNITIMGGQDHLKGKIIRIGHMGSIGKAETILCLEKLAITLHSMGAKVSPADTVKFAHNMFEKERFDWKS